MKGLEICLYMKEQQKIEERIKELQQRYKYEENSTIRLMIKSNIHSLNWVLKED